MMACDKLKNTPECYQIPNEIKKQNNRTQPKEKRAAHCARNKALKKDMQKLKNTIMLRPAQQIRSEIKELSSKKYIGAVTAI